MVTEAGMTEDLEQVFKGLVYPYRGMLWANSTFTKYHLVPQLYRKSKEVDKL